MKKHLPFLVALLLSANLLKAQLPVAMDFNMSDCNGQMRHLYSELDANNVVIIEFMMLNCVSCIDAADEIYPMYTNINTKFPGRIKYYLFGFSDAQPSYSCSKIQAWATTNGFPNMVPFDSGAAQVAYYGGMGMPTIAILAGNDHKTIYLSNEGVDNGDTLAMGVAIRNFLNTTGIEDKLSLDTETIELFPNPARDNINLNFQLKQSDVVSVQIVNLLGETLQEINMGNLSQGGHTYSLPVTSMKSGIYLLQLKTTTQQLNKKFTITD